MYELHAWLGLSDSPSEDNQDRIEQVVSEIRAMLARFATWPTVSVDLSLLNGRYFLTTTCLANRRREEAAALSELVSLVANRLPGSWGLVYERDDEMPVPPGPNAFRVGIVARGRIEVRLDPFLSPCIPTIED